MTRQDKRRRHETGQVTRQDKTREDKIRQAVGSCEDVEKNERKMKQNLFKKCQTIKQKSILEGSRGVLGGSWRRTPKNERARRFFGTLLGPS